MAYFRNIKDKHIFETTCPEYYLDTALYARMPEKDGAAEHREQTRIELQKAIKPGTKIYTIIRHVSSSGMSRSISMFYVNKGELVNIDHSAQIIMGNQFDRKNGGLKTTGCGMDMAWNMVYMLGAYLWPNGTKKPHGTRNGQPDSSGGYALNHSHL